MNATVSDLYLPPTHLIGDFNIYINKKHDFKSILFSKLLQKIVNDTDYFKPFAVPSGISRTASAEDTGTYKREIIDYDYNELHFGALMVFFSLES